MQLWMHPLTRATGYLFLALACAGATAGNVLGTRPAHIAADPGPVENDQAIGAGIWAPVIDDGYVPQGTLWSVSEAGSLRWSRWATRFPVIFSIDTGKLH